MRNLRLTFSKNLSELRKSRKWSQPDLAAAAGLSTKAIRGYEQQIRWPKPEDIDKIAEAFGIRTEDLLSSGEARDMADKSAQDAIKSLFSRLSTLNDAQTRALNSYLDTLLAFNPVKLDTKQIKKRG